MAVRQRVQTHGGWLWSGRPGAAGATSVLSRSTGSGTAFCSQAEVEHARAVAFEKFMVVPIPSEADVLKGREGVARYGASGWHTKTKGNTYDRHSRENTLLRQFGDGDTCPCVYCGVRLGRKESRWSKLTQDHIIPQQEGGKFIIANLVPACASCNSSRQAKPFDRIAAIWRRA